MISNPNLQISVAMCTYNGARFIEEQLWSIFRQTVLPQEIVVSDDGSSDQTLLLIEKTYIEASTSINGVKGIALKVIRNPSPLGVTKNFEQAIANCSEPLIALCDQDDVWKPHRLKRLISEFSAKPELLLLHHDSNLVNSNLKNLGLSTFQALEVSENELQAIHSGKALDVFLRRNLVTGATTIFRKSLYERSIPFPKNWLHDEWLAIIAAGYGSVDCLEDKLIDYRQHSSNQVGSKKPTIKHKIVRLLYPRAFRNEQLLDRANEFAIFVENKSFPETLKSHAHNKLQHEIARSDYPKPHHKRVLPIAREIRSGRYSLYGRGIQDIARDLLQSSK